MRVNSIAYLVFSFAVAACGTQNPAGTVAKVNGAPIPLSEFESVANRVANMPGKDLSNAQQKRGLLQELIKQELLFQAAMKDNVVARSDRLKKEIAREYLTEKIGRERFEPTDKDIETYFNAHKDELEKVRASHILIKPADPKDPKSWDAAKAKAEMILRKIRALGAKADFAKFAKENSDDAANKNNGGDLFFFDRKKMVPEFTTAAFSMKVGELGGPVKSEFGYHIIKMTGEQKGLDSFKQVIRWQLGMEKRKEKADRLFADLEHGSSIRIYDAVLAKANIQKTGMTGLPASHPPFGTLSPVPKAK
ncbi:MAG: peptidylprolyl isomerase [Pseudomonadota bacterium]